METALQGLRISISAFFIPYMFILYPSLLFEGISLSGMITGLLSSFIGVTCLAAASIGYLFGPLRLWQRALLFCGVLMLVHTAFWTDIAGILIIIIIAVIQKYMKRSATAE